MNPIAVFTTVATRDDALRLARMAVERRLAACVQLSAIESVYDWDGRVQQDSEVRVLFKTVDTLYDRLEQAILELHPYELPAIHAFAFDRVHAPFAEWIEHQTAHRP